ncbi:MAG: hypothetical protein AAGD25_26225 [Cyanobacteria bacterium P01_F01_bin.150]
MNVPASRDEFETVKQLLASAATYAESANRQVDRNEIAIARNAESIAKLSGYISDLKESQKKTDQQLAQVTQRIDLLTQRLDSLGQRVDSFVFESQRMFANHGQTISRLDAMISR